MNENVNFFYKNIVKLVPLVYQNDEYSQRQY